MVPTLFNRGNRYNCEIVQCLYTSCERPCSVLKSTMWFAPSKSQSTPLLPDKWEALITRSGMDFSGIVSRALPSGQETGEIARPDCFVSHETDLEGRLLVSVSQVETNHLNFIGFSRVSFQFPPSN